MRSIIISTDVFAALWAGRRAGEDSENAILERMLGLPMGPPVPPPALVFGERTRPAQQLGGGIYNNMFDVYFPPGFEIFRTYKNVQYKASARDGRWIMNGGSFPSLFALSMAIIDSRENPWKHWKYRDAKGRTDFISALRKIPPEVDETPPIEKAGPRKSSKSHSSAARRS